MDENEKHRSRAKLTLTVLVAVGLAVLAFAIWAYTGSTMPARGSAGPLSEDPAPARR